MNSAATNFKKRNGEMWDAINFLKLIELAADATAHGETDNAEDYAHAICTASRSSIDSIERAYDLIDEVSMKMLGREMDAGKGIAA
jgi:hypothetical protein